MRIRKAAAFVTALSAVPLAVSLSGSTAGEVFSATADFMVTTAYLSAGISLGGNSAAPKPSTDEQPVETAEYTPHDSVEAATAEIGQTTEAARHTAEATEPADLFTEEAEQPEAENNAQVISLNINEFRDGTDCTAAGTNSGAIERRAYGRYSTGEYITLSSGAQVRNCTSDSNQSLIDAAELLPSLAIKANSAEPQVLIIHTHATESYEPYSRDYFDSDFPMRTRDSSRNMVAVGERLAQTLADNGISAVHDGTEHDYPAYTGAYDRSEATIRSLLAQYPSIKVVIDLHRDAITNPDGSRVAPAVEINGKSAAQFMIIAGCDDGRFNMPYYIENFKLAAHIQNTTEELYPNLSRAVLFDYRNYNQHITTGSLLIEIGGHANSLDEALYTAELLGESIAKALSELS